METVFIYPDSRDPDQVRWLKAKPGQRPVPCQTGTFKEVAKQLAGHPVVLLTPGEDVLLTHVDIRVRQAEKLRRAIPYALEERLAADVDSMHFSIGNREGDHAEVAAIARDKLDGWLEALKTEHIVPREATPDMLALPWHEHEWSVVIDDARVLVRTGAATGFACDRNALESLLVGLLDSIERPTLIRLWHCDGSERLGLSSDAPAIKEHSCEGGVLSLLALAWQPRKNFNLMQGQYSQQADVMKALRPWRWAAILLGLWFVLAFGRNLIQQNQLKVEQAGLRTQIEQLYRKTFPGAKRVVNARVQMEQKLKKLRGGGGTKADSDFLELLAAAGPVVGSEKEVVLENISYRKGLLTLKIAGRSLSQLDGMKQKIQQTSGLNAELKSADSAQGKASGQIRIQRKQ